MGSEADHQQRSALASDLVKEALITVSGGLWRSLREALGKHGIEVEDCVMRLLPGGGREISYRGGVLLHWQAMQVTEDADGSVTFTWRCMPGKPDEAVKGL